MQHLLDFIIEHTLEEQLYFVAQSPSSVLELLWRRGQAESHWQLRPRGSAAAWEVIPRSELISQLESRGVEMAGVKRALNAMLGAQIAFADMLLRDANEEFGRSLVARFVLGHQSFITELQAAVEQVTARRRPKIGVVDGGGAQTTVRVGHLSLVRGSSGARSP